MTRAARGARGARDRATGMSEGAALSRPNSTGAPLTSDVANAMESRFGHSFGNVRVPVRRRSVCRILRPYQSDPLPNGPTTLDAPPSAPRPISQLDPALGPRPIELDPLTQRSPQVPPDVPIPKPFNPDIPGPTSGDPFLREPISVDPNGPTTARPGSSRSDVPFLDRGDPVSIPELFRGQRVPFPAPREPIPLLPSQRLSNPTPLLPERAPSLGSGGAAPSSFPQVPSFPEIDWRNWF